MLRGVLGKAVLYHHFLFNIYMMGMAEELERARLGVKLEDRWCGALLNVDDIVLVADLRMKLQTMLEVV